MSERSDVSRIKRQAQPQYPYTFIRTFLCGHPPECIEVNIGPGGNKQHTLLSEYNPNIDFWNDFREERKLDFVFSLHRCRKCAEEHKEGREDTHKKDVRSLEASQGEVMRERDQKRREFVDALPWRRRAHMHPENHAPYHSRLDEKIYKKEDQIVKGPGEQWYTRAIRGIEEEFAISARVSRFEKKEEQKRQELRVLQEEQEQREVQERRKLREQQNRREVWEQQEREQLCQKELQEQQQLLQRDLSCRKRVRSPEPESTHSGTAVRNSEGPDRSGFRVVERLSAETAKGSAKEEGGKVKGMHDFMKKTISKATGRSLEASRPGSAGSVKSPRETPTNSSGLVARPLGGSSRESAFSQRSLRETPAPRSSKGAEANDSGGAASRSSAGTTGRLPLAVSWNSLGKIMRTVPSTFKESITDSPEGEREKYQAMCDFYNGKE